MSKTIINVEQSEYWNEKSGPKWVKIDDAINERFSVLTDELFFLDTVVKLSPFLMENFKNFWAIPLSEPIKRIFFLLRFPIN